MTATVVIPARYGSTRFPAKIVASSTGRPLVQHVVDQVRRCRLPREIIVATDDQRIVDALARYGTKAVMTSASHQSGTDRIAEVARDLGDDLIVNVQGDEPEIEPEIVDALIERMSRSTVEMGTAATAFAPGTDVNNPNLVKVVLSLTNRALFFSRAAIPFARDGSLEAGVRYLLHLGLYAYRRDFLLKFAAWPPTPLEKTEKLEQLRALENGASIDVLQVDRATSGIDTPQQYQEFVERWKLAGSLPPAVR